MSSDNFLEIERLRAQRDVLLAALKVLVASNEDYCRTNYLFDKHGNLASDTNQDMVQARAAIREAGG